MAVALSPFALLRLRHSPSFASCQRQCKVVRRQLLERNYSQKTATNEERSIRIRKLFYDEKLRKSSQGQPINPGQQTRSAPAEYLKPGKVAVVDNVDILRTLRSKSIQQGHHVSLVPTMGALHHGHRDLMRSACKTSDEVYVSIYVNPTQFGVNEDLQSYPRTWDKDMDMIEKVNMEAYERRLRGRVTLIFAPDTRTMYPVEPPTQDPDGPGAFVNINPLSTVLEGAVRPTFFRGVATVCMKLFNIVQPDAAWFGQKDVQQVVLLQRMVRDFHIPLRLRIVRTRRESGSTNPAKGLALSSRNAYLGARRREFASVLYRALKAGRRAWDAGARSRNEIVGAAMEVFTTERTRQKSLPEHLQVRFEVDYVSLADKPHMVEIDQIERGKVEDGAILSGAMTVLPLVQTNEGEKLGLNGDKDTVRLIDNIVLGGLLGNDIDYPFAKEHQHPIRDGPSSVA